MKQLTIKNKRYPLAELFQCLHDKPEVILDDSVIKKVEQSRKTVDALVQSNKIAYGINTGFGKLSQIKISKDQVEQLQYNLIVSHAVGVGEPADDDIVWMLILLKIISLSKGFSGVRVELLESLMNMINSDYLPIIPVQGSVGASGDLAPLAHMVLPIIGLSKVRKDGKLFPTETVFKNPISLSHKEGIALINGTQFSTALGVIALQKIQNIIKVADIAGALSIEGLNGTDSAFRKDVHEVKSHAGQLKVAENLRNLLKDSEIHDSHKDCDRVQDMYSLRCIPYVHGAGRDTIEFSSKIVEEEVNSVSDNPIVLPDSNDIISSGHFHAESIGQVLDCTAIAVTGFGTISERRIFNLLDGKFGLPPFLVNNPGINSGFMMLQVTAAALVSENKTLSHPASVDTIPTGAGQEDHVSMAPWAGRKLLKIIENVENIIAIELLASTQAIRLRNGLKPGRALIPVYELIRENVEILYSDRLMEADIKTVLQLLKTGKIVDCVETKQIIN